MKNTPEEIIEIMHAFKAGKRIECCDVSVYKHRDEIWHEAKDPTWSFNVYRYRVAPEPKLRPWKPEEVPLGLWIKGKDASEVFLVHIDRVATQGMRQSGTERIHPFEYAMKHWDHSTDGGKTWKPCGVEE